MVNNELKIIDFAFSCSISGNALKELSIENKKHYEILYGLGLGSRPRHFEWNDYYSLRHILENIKDEYDLNEQQASELNSYIEKLNIKSKYSTYKLNMLT